jgi:uncharacterized protein YacL|tara:strand:+ start:418 stop:1509 length:1092 start_codon:yes stop_codon:yes gene_type:complete
MRLMDSSLSINIIRGMVLAICIAIGMIIAKSFEAGAHLGATVGACYGAFLIILDHLLRYFTFRGFSHGTIGLMVGLFCAWLILRVNFFDNIWFRGIGNHETIENVIKLTVYTGLGFLGTMLALRSNREEFSFIIPYVRFRQDSLVEQPLLVDTNVIIDGRLPKVCETGFLSGTIIIPRFVLDELHILADTPDDIKSDRGKRGLEAIEQLKQTPRLQVSIHESRMESEDMVDTKLIQLARQLYAKIATNDANLGKVARLQGVKVLNFHDLARALRPTVNPGDHLELTLMKEGRDENQAVGYLPDGTMIVVNKAARMLGKTVEVVVSGTLPTSAGRLIFADLQQNSRLVEGGATQNEGEDLAAKA